jgi:eukaryotic-like serine/threonine-protein kinase
MSTDEHDGCDGGVQRGTMEEPMMQTVGKYQLLRELGRGGMAEVFLALETGPASVERLVVLKRVLPELVGDRQFSTMFLDEARIAMRLSHPNVAHVYEVGEHEGRHFLAMEYVHGADLRTVLRRYELQTLTPALTALIGARTAGALHHAHNLQTLRGEPLNVVHRDISPANICVSHEGNVKVLDFGIAKATTNLDQTRMGVLKGKYAYMSPEQARAEPLDGRSDLFSLGIVLFEALTYRRLFKRETDAKSLEALFNQDVAPPSRYADAPVSPELDRIVLRLLDRDREQRYATAQELEHDLDSYLRRDPASAPDLARVMTDIFGDRRDLSAVVKEMLESSGEIKPSTPSRSLPTIFDGDTSQTSVYERDEAALGPGEFRCAHCGQVHDSEHQFCPETGHAVARQLSRVSTASHPALIVDELPEETEEALPDHLFSPASPADEARLELAADPKTPPPGAAPSAPPPEALARRPGRKVGLFVILALLGLTVLGAGLGVGLWYLNNASPSTADLTPGQRPAVPASSAP